MIVKYYVYAKVKQTLPIHRFHKRNSSQDLVRMVSFNLTMNLFQTSAKQTKTRTIAISFDLRTDPRSSTAAQLSGIMGESNITTPQLIHRIQTHIDANLTQQ